MAGDEENVRHTVFSVIWGNIRKAFLPVVNNQRPTPVNQGIPVVNNGQGIPTNQGNMIPVNDPTKINISNDPRLITVRGGPIPVGPGGRLIQVTHGEPRMVDVHRQQQMLDVARQNQQVAVKPGLGEVPVVDTSQLPTNINIPDKWSQVFMGPGRPFVGMMPTTRDEDAEKEPRTMQYVPNVNSTIAPRLAWGLTPFATLRFYAENVPEVAGAVRLLTEEIKSFIPSLIDLHDAEIHIPELRWMIESPDGVNPWPVWISRFLYNVLVYDAPAVFKIREEHDENYIRKFIDDGMERSVYERPTELDPMSGNMLWYCENCGNGNIFKLAKASLDEEIEYSETCVNCGVPAPDHAIQKMNKYIAGIDDGYVDMEKAFGHGKIVGLRIVDGSTIFALIDERGEQPLPPAPAFTQVIWGVPRMFLNSHQLWYRPRHLRADAPYGRSFIEDSMQAVTLLFSLWDYEFQKYQIGNIPEMAMTLPPDWGQNADQILEFEAAYNARMSGSNQERVRIRFFPSGTSSIATKEITFNRESYDAAVNTIRMSVGIPKSEAGEAPEGMLGGKSFAEAMQSAFYRMGLSPLQTFIESLFNDILKENGYVNIRFQLKFPNDSLDPEKEEAKWQGRFAQGIARRDEARQGVGMTPIGGDDGKFLNSPKQGGGPEGGPGGDGGGPGGGGPGGMPGLPGANGGGPGGMPGVQPPKLPGGNGKMPGKINVAPPTPKNIAVKLAKAAEKQTGVMVALYMPEKIAKKMVSSIPEWPEGSEPTKLREIHVSLAILGDITDPQNDQSKLNAVVSNFVNQHPSLNGKINGMGRFIETHKDNTHCIYANFDCPGLNEYRGELVSLLEDSGFKVSDDHGFTPHLTIGYIPEDAATPDMSLSIIENIKPVIGVAYGEDLFLAGSGNEEVEKARPSRTLCMKCKKNPPTKAVMWANGVGIAWFCGDCYPKWAKEHVGDIDNVKDIEGEMPIDLFKVEQPTNLFKPKEEGKDGNHYTYPQDNIDPAEFEVGMKEEQEHAETVHGDENIIRQIVLDHLKEDPHYYTHLKQAGMIQEDDAEKMAKLIMPDLMKHCGVCPDDDEYFDSKVIHEVTALMPHQGANVSQIVAIGGDDMESRPAVWKPRTGEKESLREWVGGDLYRRDEAAYLLDRELSPNQNQYLVPVTFITEIDGVKGSVQHYVRGRNKDKKPVMEYNQTFVERAGVFDFIAGQVDRIHKNWLTHPDDPNRMILIDNQLTFPHKKERIRSDFVTAIAGKKLSEETIDAVYLAVGNRDLWKDLQDILEDEEAVNQAKERAEMIVNDGKVPEWAAHPEDPDKGKKASEDPAISQSVVEGQPIAGEVQASEAVAKDGGAGGAPAGAPAGDHAGIVAADVPGVYLVGQEKESSSESSDKDDKGWEASKVNDGFSVQPSESVKKRATKSRKQNKQNQ